MAERGAGSVAVVFDLMLEEVEAQINLASRAVAEASEVRDFARVGETAERAEWLVAFRDKVATLRQEWEDHVGPPEPADQEPAEDIHRRNLGRLRRGVRTPEPAYFPYILRALRDMGGSGPIGDVLDRVGQQMKSVLKKVDLAPLNSDPDTPRWRNSAQWARSEMAKKGLLRDDSPRGVWEISDAGRKWLQEQGG